MQDEIKAIVKQYKDLKIDLNSLDRATVLSYLNYYLKAGKPAELYRDKSNFLKIRPIEKQTIKSAYLSFAEPDSELKDFIDSDIPGNKIAKKEVERVISEFKKGLNSVGFMLTGQNATGKTFLLRALATALRKQGIVVCHVFPKDFFDYTDPQKQDSRKYLNLFKNTKVLILDDIGTENGAGWLYKSTLVPVLEYRMNREMTTIFASNFNLKEYAKKITETTGDIQLALQICSKVKILVKGKIIEIVKPELKRSIKWK